VLQVGDDDFEQIVGLVGNHMAGDNLGRGNDRLLERRGAIIGVAIDFHADEDREGETDLVAPQHRAVAFDIPLPLQPIDPSQARRRGQPDTLGEIGIRQPAVCLRNNSAVNRVEVQFWHIHLLNHL
jgi:hypothetical protein